MFAEYDNMNIYQYISFSSAIHLHYFSNQIVVKKLILTLCFELCIDASQL